MFRKGYQNKHPIGCYRAKQKRNRQAEIVMSKIDPIEKVKENADEIDEKLGDELYELTAELNDNHKNDRDERLERLIEQDTWSALKLL